MVSNLFRSIESAELNALLWLCEANKQCHGKGFAHSRINFLPQKFAWRKSYPETSGYLIENFLQYNNGIIEKDITIALCTADWLSSIQSKDGFYFSGVKKKSSSVFNTAQIIFGLFEAYKYTKNIEYLNNAEKAKKWIIESMNEDGNIVRGLYHSGYFASYYSRAIWPMLLIADQKEIHLLEKSLQYLWNKRNEYNSFKDLGFSNTNQYLTHTIAYGLEGFMESSLILNNQKMLNNCLEILHFVANTVIKNKGLDGIYDNRWNTVSKMKCLTGQAQFISLFAKANKLKPTLIFENACVLLMKEMLSWQIKSKNSEHHGAFPASLPTYSSYFPFQYINWTNKFFLDACYQMKAFI